MLISQNYGVPLAEFVTMTTMRSASSNRGQGTRRRNEGERTWADHVLHDGRPASSPSPGWHSVWCHRSSPAPLSDTTEPAAESHCAGERRQCAGPATELPDLSGQSLTISNWDAYTPEDLIPGFEEATGATVEFTTHATNEEIVAKLLQGGGEGYDVVFVSAQFAQQLDEAGLLLDIDPELVPNLSQPRARGARARLRSRADASRCPYTWGTTGLCYRSDLLTEAPTSWNDLLDAEPRRRTAG